MIFSKEIEKVCAYCEHGKPVIGTEDILCTKKGLVKASSCCTRFLYTPLHRIPPKANGPDFSILNLPKLED